MKNCCHHGFTLVELLVAVAILGVLVALSVNVLGNGMSKAREAAGLSNLRAITQAVLLSTADRDGRFPVMRNYPWEEVLRPDGEPAEWMHEVLIPYLNVVMEGDVMPGIFRNPAVEAHKRPAWLADEGIHSHFRYNTLRAPGKRSSLPGKAMVCFNTVWPDWPSEDMPLQSGGPGLHISHADGSVQRISYQEYLDRNTGGESGDNAFFGEGWQ
jgi:prepilin-type N-terminal cleavage/methylation domain-containing protein